MRADYQKDTMKMKMLNDVLRLQQDNLMNEMEVQLETNGFYDDKIGMYLKIGNPHQKIENFENDNSKKDNNKISDPLGDNIMVFDQFTPQEKRKKKGIIDSKPTTQLTEEERAEKKEKAEKQ